MSEIEKIENINKINKINKNDYKIINEILQFKSRLKMTEKEYDNFLKIKKENRFIRIGPFISMAKSILHRCQDPNCKREWRPTPKVVLQDDYHCPSCVLHHRNNIERFKNKRLEWTGKIPNTFYIFSISDPNLNKNNLFKFGRTQNKDPHKRYSKSELNKYKMKLIFSIREKLKNMIIVENWWKDEAKNGNLFVEFTDQNFHGCTEIVELEKYELIEFIKISKEIAKIE